MNFQQYNNITSIVIPSGTVLCNDMTALCFGLKNLKTVDIANDVLNSVVNMSDAYGFCSFLTSSPVCGDNVVNMSDAYYWCYNITGNPVCGENVINMYRTYYQCYNLTGHPVCGSNVVNMYETYAWCNNITGAPVCGINVVDMSNTYRDCDNLRGAPACGPNVTNMSCTYADCINLTGSPVCGEKVIDMMMTYYGCTNLTGSPVCGDNVTRMYRTYDSCYRLTGFPICGPNVTNMYYTYMNCTNLIGSPVCGNNVTIMYSTYSNCTNLTGSPVCGENVTNISGTYQNCPNLHGNMYMYSQNVSNVRNCFNGRNTSKMLNIYVTKNSTSQSTLMNYTNAYSIVGKSCTWINDATNNRYYNTSANIYIYPVDNVFQTRIDNGDIGLKIIASPKTDYIAGDEFDPTGMMLALCFNDSNPIIISDYTYHTDENNKCIISCIHDGQEYSTELQLVYDTPLLSDFVYRDNGDQTYTITAWNGTLEGEASTKLIFPADVSIII